MKCPEFQEQWQRRLDGQPAAEAAELERHLASCAPCRRLDAAARRLEFGLRVLPPADLPRDLTERIVTAVLRERRQRILRGRRILVAASLAAALLLAATGYAWLHLRAGSPPGPPAPVPVAKLPPPPVERTPAGQPPVASLQDSVQEAGSAVVSLTRRTAGETVDQTRMLLPERVPTTGLVNGGVLPRDLVAGQPAQSLQETRQGVSSGIEPMTTSARRAVDLFLNELPPVPEQAKPGT